ncbi:MAG: hypothetical protein QXK32_10455, partial [Candidatus Jordarchaeales archaeon]
MWDEAVSAFSFRLRQELGNLLLCVVASPREDAQVKGANVLVVLAEDRFELRARVLEVARSVGREVKSITITPFITTAEDEETIYTFLHSYDGEGEKWSEAVQSFKKRLEETLKDALLHVDVAPSENFIVYGANVLVVLAEDRFELRARVLEVARSVGREVKSITITPFITTA